MPIGREPSRPVSAISQAYPDRVEVRGRDLTGDLMGRLTFTEYFHLLLTGDEPTDEQRFFLDLLLVSIAEHGMMPTNVAARMTLAADPSALQGAVAAGILGAGPVVLGASEECARLLADASARVTAGERPEDVVADVVRAAHDAGDRVPGFGHPVHRPVDPRAERILELADERGVSAEHVALARLLRDAVAAEWGKPLPMNVSLADRRGDARPRLPGVDGQGGADPRAHRGPARASRRGAGEPARVLHGRQGRRGRRVRAAAHPVMLEPAVETRPWDEQLALDDQAFREQLAYLLERSPFYREKLDLTSAVEAGGLADIGRLPMTEKHELKATATAENPVGAHLCVDRTEIVRIYSTSGTTGTPSYIPLTATRPRQLGHGLRTKLRRLRRHARASGSSRPTTPGRSSPEPRSRVRPHRALPHPGRDREHRAARSRDRAPAAGGGRADSVVRGLPRRVDG